MMEIGAVEKIIMQGILKSVMDFNNSLEILEPGVKKYFKYNLKTLFCICNKSLVDVSLFCKLN
jgi:hypothetical protein